MVRCKRVSRPNPTDTSTSVTPRLFALILVFDDTNPTKEDVEYVEAIKEDIQWLGYQWGNEYYASDYFQQLWDFAIRLIEEGKAYIDEQTSEQIAQQKGTPTQPGVDKATTSKA